MLIVTGPLTEEELHDWLENQARERACRSRRTGTRVARVVLWSLMVACLAHGGPWAWATLAVSFCLHVLSEWARRV